MAHLNKIDINGRTYYLQHLTDGKYEAQLPALTQDAELLLSSQIVNSVTSEASKNGSRAPLSAYQGYLLNTKLNQEVLDREADVDEEQARAEAAEQVLADNLTAEINRAKAAEETNATAIDKKVDKVDGKGLSDQNYTSSEKTKLEGIEDGANKYVHPSYSGRTSGLYKITVDTFGHVSSVVAVTKEDIVGLGVPAQDTTYGNATTSNSGLLSSVDKATYDGYAATIASLQSQIDELKALVESYHSTVAE